MSRKSWDGVELVAALRTGAERLHARVAEVNALNVFPVPDGDTGTNMLATLRAAVAEGEAALATGVTAIDVVSEAVARGARLLLGNQRSGALYAPTVIDRVDPRMTVVKEETFGPVAPLYRFKTEAELLERANDTEFGLAAYFYSRDIGRIWRVAEGVASGIVGINVGIISTEIAPFGGVKESGIGREGSKYGLEEFLEVKYLAMGDITK